MSCIDPVFYQRLEDATFPEDAIFVVDDGLPSFIAQALPDEPILVKAGEELKNLASIENLAQSVLQRRTTRPMTLVAIGGGSIGDAVGFLASILWRGVDLWHIPTTLLAMVDSAHGGKTAVNLGGRKNQLGTFYPAKNVLICQDILDALPLDQREEGLAELLKALLLGAPDQLESLQNQTRFHRLLSAPIADEQETWENLLKEAIAIKARIVAQDPQERSGLRRILNLGHTAGHAVEAQFELPHGRAIAWGLASALILSTEKANLTSEAARRLFQLIEPLLVPLPTALDEIDKERFISLVGADKKRVNGQLISILLNEPGEPLQTTEAFAEDWWQALLKAQQTWLGQTFHILPPAQKSRPPHHSVALPPDKSQANRAAIIAHLRPAPTQISALATLFPADMVDLSRALERLRSATNSCTVQTGLGGTTTRFLLASAAARQGQTTLICPPALLRRPHQPLIDALTRAGATIDATARGFIVQGWPIFPSFFEVEGKSSSQFASALALLAATGNPFELRIKGPLRSRPYFELTLQLLKEAGVEIEARSDDHFYFQPGPDFHTPHQIEIDPDWSSAAIWLARATLEPNLEPVLPTLPANDHPDRRFIEILQALHNQQSPSIEIDLEECPDLAPVLAALCTQLPGQQILFGAPHLRYKESNRIDDLVRSFKDVGLSIETTPDGLMIPAGTQKPKSDQTFQTYGDHRLVMAALILATVSEGMMIQGAQYVMKSYPDLLRQFRRQGFQIVPAATFTISDQP